MYTFDKKELSLFKKTLKTQLVIASKYGISKNKDTEVEFYIVDNIYPVVVINQEESPWGDIIAPTTLSISDMNIDSEKLYRGEYENESNSIKVNLTEFKKVIQKITSIEIDENNDIVIEGCDIKGKTTVNNTLYAIKSIKDAMNEGVDIISIDDSDDITNLNAQILLLTNLTLRNDDGENVYIPYQAMPNKPEYIRCIKRKQKILIQGHVNATDISTVRLITRLKSNEINNFYTYIDIWGEEDD